jgi:hypothetical protein
MTSQFAAQRVKIPPWEVHISGAGGAIQGCQLILQFSRVRWVDACLRAVSEEHFKPCVPERLDHFPTVSPADTAVKRKSAMMWTPSGFLYKFL